MQLLFLFLFILKLLENVGSVEDPGFDASELVQRKGIARAQVVAGLENFGGLSLGAFVACAKRAPANQPPPAVRMYDETNNRYRLLIRTAGSEINYRISAQPMIAVFTSIKTNGAETRDPNRLSGSIYLLALGCPDAEKSTTN